MSKGFSSTKMTSSAVARSPSFAILSPTRTRPASIQPSISRREPRQAEASSFWSRSPCWPPPLLVGGFGGRRGGLVGGRLGRRGRWRARRRGELDGARDLLERRQFF